MFGVTFKNVGQGDSIVLEWYQNENKNVALIDCNIYNNTNPLLDYIKADQVKEIKFIVLSHPHFDHYSGFYQLLTYCRDNNIRIKHFLHTSIQVPSFLRTAAKSAIAEKELTKLFKLLRELIISMGLEVASIQAGSLADNFALGENMEIKILSPSQEELDKYISGVNFEVGQVNEGPFDNPNANWLSTILKIKINKEFLLLTSDASKKSLVRIDKKKADEINSFLLLGQSPHHGAFTNHNNSFWKKRKRHPNLPIVFSVGKNHYNHPSTEVIKFFIKNEYKIYSTNLVGGLITDKSKIASEASKYLDLFSVNQKSEKNSDLEGDKSFNFK